ncbi:unnamed protein product [Rotaria sordida]|uniref:Uncharacterized protein n=2 Tax=Rotaria sordida TaxID=392033 RepID=A0A818TL16_9BILA|nr:unnamed protein product [Rotaria sordida]CAF3683479.1 unnamed protein product [Rotaria sordida]CAF3749313.1 unnamed protein product [Rotaria sordida]
MAEKIVYNDSKIKLMNSEKSTMNIYDDIIISTNSSMSIFNLCNDMAKKIKDEAVNVIEDTFINANSKT